MSESPRCKTVTTRHFKWKLLIENYLGSHVLLLRIQNINILIFGEIFF